MSSASIANCGCRTGPSRRNESTPPFADSKSSRRRDAALAACDFRREIARPAREVAPKHLRRDEAPAEQHPEPRSEAPLAELREHERDIIVLLRDTSANSKSDVERLFDEPRRFRVVGELEAWIDIGFERELAQQRQTERVDRGDLDIAEPVLQIAPAREVGFG